MMPCARSCNGWSLRSGACSCSPSFVEGEFIHNKFYFINIILSVTQENTVDFHSVGIGPLPVGGTCEVRIKNMSL